MTAIFELIFGICKLYIIFVFMKRHLDPKFVLLLDLRINYHEGVDDFFLDRYRMPGQNAQCFQTVLHTILFQSVPLKVDCVQGDDNGDLFTKIFCVIEEINQSDYWKSSRACGIMVECPCLALLLSFVPPSCEHNIFSVGIRSF